MEAQFYTFVLRNEDFFTSRTFGVFRASYLKGKNGLFLSFYGSSVYYTRSVCISWTEIARLSLCNIYVAFACLACSWLKSQYIDTVIKKHKCFLITVSCPVTVLWSPKVILTWIYLLHIYTYRKIVATVFATIHVTALFCYLSRIIYIPYLVRITQENFLSWNQNYSPSFPRVKTICTTNTIKIDLKQILQDGTKRRIKKKKCFGTIQ